MPERRPASSWLEAEPGTPFPVENLPYGVGRFPDGSTRLVCRVGDHAVDLAGLAGAGLLDDGGGWFASRSLNRFLAAGRTTWEATRARLTALLTDAASEQAVRPHVVPLSGVRLELPVEIADYVDFYSSLGHASNLGRLFRPDAEPLLPNWRALPVGYHGRAGTVVVSGTPVRRPCGQRRGEGGPVFGPSVRLDIEAEVGFVVGVPSPLGEPVPAQAFREHVFGVVLVNDWSARDIQGWEYQPLGPFLGKSFATTMSAWVVPLDALAAARVPPRAQDPAPLPYLHDPDPWALDLTLEVSLNGSVISRPPYAGIYWTPGQQVAHLTVNGASLRTGDLFASGTVSGPAHEQRGSLIELTWGGREPLTLADGATRTFLEDGDTVTIRASAPGLGGAPIGLGEVTGTITPAGCG